MARTPKGRLNHRPRLASGRDGQTPIHRDDRPEVNLFVDHSQIVQLEALRRGIWGTNGLWGRVVTFKKD